MTAMRIRSQAAICSLLLAALLPGCAGTQARRDLGSNNPLDRARAVVAVAERGDVGAVHKLVDLLEDGDEAVRMYAIMALRRLCGEDLGYRYYANEAERGTAVARWREALRAGTVKLRPPASTAVAVEPRTASGEASAGGGQR